jgi:hypothetical protein
MTNHPNRARRTITYNPEMMHFELRDSDLDQLRCYPEWRKCLVLRYRNPPLGYVAISEQTGMPIGTVRSRLNRAKRRILANRKAVKLEAAQ